MRLSILTRGLIKDNPTLVQLVGMCPVLAITTTLENGIGMGLAVVVVLALSNLLVSLSRSFTPERIRIPIFVVIIATFVTIVGLVIEAYVPSLHKSLGIFIPLIVVNCLILARAEAFAFSHGPIDSLLDGIGMGLGFTIALMIISAIREILGTGAIAFGGTVLFQLPIPQTISMILPPGAFLVLALVLAVKNAISNRKEEA
ncbi:MAG: electron transport complex subunit E [Tissierellia bacterium]|jgi:electron transport complex protein RnfE|nr:electron transport complex subunit E [Tissierellia bacterium]